jgi:Mn-containing catalase
MPHSSRNFTSPGLLVSVPLTKGEFSVFLRIDRLQIELPLPAEPAPNAAAALQELLGGKYGEMSTLGNYLFQSFNFRSKSKLKPFYSLVANITAEELGHVELVSNGVALLNNGPGAPDDVEADISNAPFADMKDIRLAASFLSNGGGAMPMNSNGASWNMDFVTTTGNVIIDLLHNFHLECGARLHKLRVYETLTDPTGREVCGYLLVRGGVHAHAYALALEKLTGVDIKKMLPTPNINLDKIPESQKYLDEGSHRRLYRFSADDYKEMAGIWQAEKALPGDPPGTLRPQRWYAGKGAGKCGARRPIRSRRLPRAKGRKPILRIRRNRSNPQ